MNALQEVVAAEGAIPLAWAGATMEMSYLNWGDAMSPVMVALMSGLPIRRVPTRSKSTRMGAVGTVGHGFDLGKIFFWGTGSSEWKNPSAPVEERVPFQPTPGTEIFVHATRGPESSRILGGAPGIAFGDPVWLLPRFYRPAVEKKYELGIILHLSELDGRALDAGPTEAILRAQIPPEWRDKICTINTLTTIDTKGLQDKTDEILACKRIVSTSLHGMVVAESYDIPCLYFATRGSEPNARGLRIESLDHDFLDLRIRDLYKGIGRQELAMYVQPRNQATDFAALFDAIDANWQPCGIDEERLIEAFPLGTTPIEVAPDGAMWTHPAITGIQFQHDVAQVRRDDAARNPKAKAHG